MGPGPDVVTDDVVTKEVVGPKVVRISIHNVGLGRLIIIIITFLANMARFQWIYRDNSFWVKRVRRKTASKGA